MSNYIRVINRAYWPCEEKINEGIDVNTIGANTITQEFRTKDNTLSLWAVENTEDVVLAMICKASKIDDMFTLKIEDELLKNSKLEVVNEGSNSLIKDINKFHYNIKNLNYKKLANVSKLIIEALKNEDNLEFFTKNDIIRILKKAIKEGRLSKESLNKKIQKEIEKTA